MSSLDEIHFWCEFPMLHLAWPSHVILTYVYVLGSVLSWKAEEDMIKSNLHCWYFVNKIYLEYVCLSFVVRMYNKLFCEPCSHIHLKLKYFMTSHFHLLAPYWYFIIVLGLHIFARGTYHIQRRLVLVFSSVKYLSIICFTQACRWSLAFVPMEACDFSWEGPRLL